MKWIIEHSLVSSLSLGVFLGGILLITRRKASASMHKNIVASLINILFLGGLFLLFLYTATKFISALPFFGRYADFSIYVAIFAFIAFLYKNYEQFILVVGEQEVRATTSLITKKIEMTIEAEKPGDPAIVEKVDALELYRQGLHIIHPWQNPVNRIVHLVDCSMIIKSGKDKSYTDKKKVRLNAAWSVVVKPDPENLRRYFLFTEETIRTVVSALIDQKLSDFCAQKTSEWILGNKKTLSATVSQFFDGAGTKSYYEKFYGIRIDDPILSDIDLNEKDREAEAQINRAELIREKAQDLVDASKDATGKPTLSFEEAFRRMSVAIGATKEEIKVYKGLENAKRVFFDGSGHGHK